MQLRKSSVSASWVPLVLFFSVWCAHAKKDAPRIEKKEFDSLISTPLYFNDTDTILVQERDPGIIWRTENAGFKWNKVADVEEGFAADVWLHPYDNKIAYALGRGKEHYITKDQGKSWKKFYTKEDPSEFRMPLSFHGGNSDKVLFQAMTCHGFRCDESTYYTTDSFGNSKLLRDSAKGCHFAHGTPLFSTSDDDEDDDRTLCVVKGRYSSDPKDNRLVISDNFFKDEEEPSLEGDRAVKGIISMAVVKKFLVVAAKAENTRELALYVTDDAKTWHRAEFPNNHKLEEEAYTVLESTDHSIQVDVMTTLPKSAMGILFSSNSNGTYFTENIAHTNRNFQGIVDFEKVQDIQGIVLVNVVDNWEEVERTDLTHKKINSKISFDEGRTFQPITSDGKQLHLHSVTDMSNTGRVFSSAAPGLVMGIGNTGTHLKAYKEGDLYISNDAGLTWELALKQAHKYEFGDQGSVLVAIYDEGPTNKLQYSTTHGKKWETAKLDNEVRARLLTTTPDSTGLKFVLLATEGGGSETKYFIYSIDFEDLHERKCTEDDLERWDARVDKDNNPRCVMGHTQYYMRRKAEADCFIDEEFKDPQPHFENCKCGKEDFECDYNFVRDDSGDKCIPATTLTPPADACKSEGETFLGSSGFRLIPGNTCDRNGGEDLDRETERPCKDSIKKPASGEVSHEITPFPDADSFQEFYYLERTGSNTGTDETIIMRTNTGKVYISNDHGKKWRPLDDFEGEDIVQIIPHQYFNEAIFFLTASKKVFYSVNFCETIASFEAKAPSNVEGLPVLSFHPDYRDWLIWTGAKDCGLAGGDCHSDAWYSTDRGDDWDTLQRYVRKCEFIKKQGRGDSKMLVYCERHKDEKLDGQLELVSSDNWFADYQVHFDDVLSFATMSEFIIVANHDPDDRNNLKVDASIDGQTFADAKWPKDLNVSVQRAYTVLDSSTHAVFLQVAVSGREGFEFGRLVKSNSNGTSYVLSATAVNQNSLGYVDFEKMQGLEGVALINAVENMDDVDGGKSKKLRTMITHNDGAQWARMKAPQTDAEGKKYECDVSDLESCSLHLHGYTERKDPRDTFSSPSAIGLMMGVGNVGPYLERKSNADTFITRNGGLEWHSVKKGNYMWEYGDQGSIIVVVVEEPIPTRELFFSLDEGQTWQSYAFSDTDMIISHLTTVPSDNSLNFLLWGRKGGDIVTVNLDFSGLRERERLCHLNENDDNDSKSDYILWEPKHPLQEDNCLFGHIAQYHRKKLESDCYNGRKIDHIHNISKNCSCTRQDYECDYNYQTQPDGGCGLVPGLEPISHIEECKKNPDLVSFYEPRGYRKIPLSTCEGGRDLLKSIEHACPGHDQEFDEGHKGLGGFGLFVVAFLLPVIVATTIGYWVWTHWDGKFGRIRLGDAGSAFDATQPWISYPVAAVSAIVALVAAVPLLVVSLWRSAMGLFSGGKRYTTRQSFARGRGDYVGVDADEDELLGDDDGEEDV